MSFLEIVMSPNQIDDILIERGLNMISYDENTYTYEPFIIYYFFDKQVVNDHSCEFEVVIQL